MYCYEDFTLFQTWVKNNWFADKVTNWRKSNNGKYYPCFKSYFKKTCLDWWDSKKIIRTVFNKCKLSQAVSGAITKCQTRWLITNRNEFLTVLESGGLGSEASRVGPWLSSGSGLLQLFSHGEGIGISLQPLLWGHALRTCPILAIIMSQVRSRLA